MSADRLDILKTKCEEEIKDTEDKLRVLKAKLANLVSLGQESEKLANPESEPNRYVDIGLTEAVFDAVKSLWEVRKTPSSAPAIKGFLLARGFQAGDNFDTAVYTILGRLSESGRIICITKVLAPIRDVSGNKVRIPARKFYRLK